MVVVDVTNIITVLVVVVVVVAVTVIAAISVVRHYEVMMIGNSHCGYAVHVVVGVRVCVSLPSKQKEEEDTNTMWAFVFL